MSDDTTMSGAEADISSDGDSSFEDDEVPLPPSPLKEGTSEPFSVVLKGGSPWGFNLKALKGTRTPVQISEIVLDGKADQHGVLKVGDYILLVNDVKCTNVPEAVQLIESAFRTLTLQVWRGTTEPLTSPARSASILQKVRESTRQQPSTQDDSALLSESKNRMKPRQRRIESFHGRRGSAHSSSSTASAAKLTSGTVSPRTSATGENTPSPSESSKAKEPLKGWATENDLSSSRKPIIMSGSQTRVPSSRFMQLSSAKSSPSLNNEELVNAATTPRGYSPKPSPMLAITKSTPDIPDQTNYENVTSPTSPKSPSWNQQIFTNRNTFEFPTTSVRRSAGSPRNSYAGGSPRTSYSSGSPRNSYAGYSSNYPQSSYPGFSPTSVPSSIAFPQTPSVETRNSGAYAHQSQRLIGANVNSYDDSSNQTPSKSHDRRSLPPQMLYQYRQDFLKENNKPEGPKQLTSMPVTREEEEADRGHMNHHQNGVDTNVPYTPPAPPVRNISSLKYVSMTRNHEKYPSWPVTMANPLQNLGPPVEAHPVEAQRADKMVDKDSEREKSDKSNGSRASGKSNGSSASGKSNGSRSSDRNGSVTLERKSSDEGKQPRNQSDPGFKKTKNKFYTSLKPKIDQAPNYENLKSEEERFDDFCKQAKPGYPPPKFDPDGHNYGDEKYSIPSPPERDTPHLEVKSLVEKIAAVISPNSYQQFTVSTDTSVSKSNKVDSATSPAKIPGFYFQKALSQSQTTPKTMVDSSTSPLSSPKGDSINLQNISANTTSESYLSPTDRSRGLIIRQKPYYNTSTQTDGVYIPDNQSKTEGISDSGEQSNVSKLSSTSSVSTGTVTMDTQSHVISRSDTSTVSSGIGSMTISDHASAPMLRKLSEEFFRGKLSGNLPSDQRQSSASNYEDLKDEYESPYGNLKEAESYSSVIIHPHETSAPFGSDEFGPGSLSQDTITTEPDNSTKYKARHSLDPSVIHRGSGSFSMPPRSLHESRFTSESNLSGVPTPRTHSQSLFQLNRPSTSSSSSSSSHVDLRKTMTSDSSSSRPHGSMEARLSSGSRISSDSSMSGRPHSRLESDSVFYENKSSPVSKESADAAAGSTLGRKESMKMAYGTYDENERHYATPYGHQRNSSEVLSTSTLSPDQSLLHSRSASQTDYMPMGYNNEANRLDLIQEEGSEIRWQEAVMKSRSLSKDAKLSTYANFSYQSKEQKTPSKGSDSEGSSSEKKKETTKMRRTVSEQIRPSKPDKKQKTRKSETKDYSSSGESSKGNKSDGESILPSGFSDSDLKQKQQRAVLDFFERKVKTSDSSEPLSPRSETAPVEFPPPPPENKPPLSPTSQLNTPQSPLSDLTKRYKYTKAQRTESLRRTRSSISSTSSRESDYVEMNRLQRATHYQTEWSRIRSQEGGMAKRPLSIGSDISAGEHFPASSPSPHTSDGDSSSHHRSASETIPKQLEAELDKVVDIPNQDEGQNLEYMLSKTSPHPSNNDSMVTSPIYNNFPGGDYPRRPPPPVPGHGNDDKPPELPPRSYQRSFTHSKSESMLSVNSISDRSDPKLQKWEQSTNGTLREDAYAQQLRRQARRYSEQQHKPISMQVVSTKSTMQVSLTQSYKQEPNQAMEAMPLQKHSSSSTSDKVSSPHHSPPSRGSAMSPDLLGLPPLPTPLKNGDTELMETSMTLPPPPEFMEGAEQIAEKEKRYADDSYASYKSKAAPREVGKYKRAISDSKVLRPTQDAKLRDSEQNNITDTPNKPPRKKLELGRNSPDFGQRSNSPSMTGADSHMPSPLVPSFKAADTSLVPNVQKSVTKPLQSVSVQKLNSPSTSGSSGSFITTVVQRPMPSNQVGLSVPEEQRRSVKDRVKTIEVFSHSPVLNKSGTNRESPLTERKTVFPSESNMAIEQVNNQQNMDSLEKLESSVKSSNSFRDRLRPVVRKIEPERIEDPSSSSSRRSRDRKSIDNNDIVVGLPPEVPSRTYKDINNTGDQRSTRDMPYRSNSFQTRNPSINNPRPYDRSKNTSGGYSPVEMNNYKNRSGREPQRSPSQSVPEPQVPFRGQIQPNPQRHDIPDKYSDKTNLDQTTNTASPEHRVRHSSYNEQSIDINPAQHQDSAFAGHKRKMDNSIVKHGKSQTTTTTTGQDVSSPLTDKNIQNDNMPQSRSFSNTQSEKVDNSIALNRKGDSFSDKNQTRNKSHSSEKSPTQVISYHRGDFRNWKHEGNDRSVLNNNSNQGIQDSRPSGIQSNHSNSQSDLNVNNMADIAVHSVEISHTRQPSAEELECDQRAKELAQVLKESDKELSTVLANDSRKGRMRFMDGLLPTGSANEDVKRRPRSQSDVKEEKKEEQKEEPASPMPSEYYVSPPKAMIELEIRRFGDTSQLTQDIGDNDTLAQKKEELLQRMVRKVDILKDDRKELLTDIDENESLGRQVLTLVDEKCRSQQEKDKYKSYIEDIDKIIRLLLKLSGLLARAENTIQGLTENTNEKIKKMTYDKRDRLHKQHEDAKELKVDIDRRSDQVETFLKDVFSASEMDDYHYYIKMKSKYTIQMQELEDKITLGNEQIGALQKSIPNNT